MSEIDAPEVNYDELTKLMSIDELGQSLILSVVLGDTLFANACREAIKLRKPNDKLARILRAFPREATND